MLVIAGLFQILKDTIIRYKVLKSCPINYVPGWDCHGLPIELKALTGGGSDLTPIETREKGNNNCKVGGCVVMLGKPFF